MNATVIANLSFILFWLIVIGVILLGGQRWPPLATWRHKLLAQWQPALAIALIALVSSGLQGARLLSLYVPAIFCQALRGLAAARSIAGFEPLAVWAAWRQGMHVWRTLVLALGTALLAAVVGMLLGTVGISIARQLFHETYDMSATTEAGQAFTLSKWQLFFYFLWGSGIMVCPARCAGIHLHWRSPVPLQWVQN